MRAILPSPEVKNLADKLGLLQSENDQELFYLFTPDGGDKESTLKIMSEAEKTGFNYCGISSQVGEPNSIVFKYVGIGQ